MINVLVWSAQAPALRVNGEVRLHVFMYFLLKVDAAFSISPYHHIGAHTTICGNIPHGVVN